MQGLFVVVDGLTNNSSRFRGLPQPRDNIRRAPVSRMLRMIDARYTMNAIDHQQPRHFMMFQVAIEFLSRLFALSWSTRWVEMLAGHYQLLKLHVKSMKLRPNICFQSLDPEPDPNDSGQTARPLCEMGIS